VSRATALGSAHAELEAMKAKGTAIPADEVARALDVAKTAGFERFKGKHAVNAKCETCHNGTCGDFDFDKMWPEITHTVSKAD